MSTLKSIVLIVVLTLLAYGGSLSHQFMGDDVLLFRDNDFYFHFDNIKKLISKDFIMYFEDVDLSRQGMRSNSGCVSYRPMTAVSFFIDAFLWGKNPFGYHLTNVILHILNSLLVFFFVVVVFKQKEIAFLAGCIFGLHPIQSELVNNIGYRSDLLVCLFYMLAVLSFLNYLNLNQTRKLYLYGSQIFFLFALLSKEVAIMFPLMMHFLYHYGYKNNHNDKPHVKIKIFDLLGYAGIALFYIYIYYFVFPNSNLIFHSSLGFKRQFALIFVSFYEYIKVFFLPFTVSVLPPLYFPPMETLWNHRALTAFFLIIVSVLSFFKFTKINPKVSFLIAWFFISYLPVSNIIVIPNPIAFRFMYVPSVALSILLALFFMDILNNLKKVKYRWIIISVYLMVCLVTTVSNNIFFDNNITACEKMLNGYPRSKQPHLVLGFEYANQKNYQKAREHFQKYLALETTNPFVLAMQQDYFIYHMLGRCFPEDTKRAIEAFHQSLMLKPDYPTVYADLAKAYIFENNFEKALTNALKSIELQEDLTIGYVYAIHCLVKMGKIPEAKKLLGEALEISPKDTNLKYQKDVLKMLNVDYP